MDPGAALGLLEHSGKVSAGPLDELVLGHEDDVLIAPNSQKCKVSLSRDDSGG